MNCYSCGKTIYPNYHFHGVCEFCDSDFQVALCGDCLIDADLTCPECGGTLQEVNEQNAGDS